MLFTLLLLIIIVVSMSIYIWLELSVANDRLLWLEERLVKLERDAVKVTFTGEPKKIPPCVGHELESQKEENKQTKKRKPKTTKDWEDEFDLGGHE